MVISGSYYFLARQYTVAVLSLVVEYSAPEVMIFSNVIPLGVRIICKPCEEVTQDAYQSSQRIPFYLHYTNCYFTNVNACVSYIILQEVV